MILPTLDHAGPYNVILADPPWHFKTYSSKGEKKTPQAHYETLSIDDIMAMPVAEFAANDAALFLWMPNYMVHLMAKVMAAWGFEFSAKAFTWCKLTRTGKRWQFGMGYRTRQQTEGCYLALRGSLPVASHSVREIIEAPIREHSEKPDAAYARIEELYGEGVSRLELFARQEWPGWDCWGTDVGSTPFVVEAHRKDQ